MKFIALRLLIRKNANEFDKILNKKLAVNGLMRLHDIVNDNII